MREERTQSSSSRQIHFNSKLLVFKKRRREKQQVNVSRQEKKSIQFFASYHQQAASSSSSSSSSSGIQKRVTLTDYIYLHLPFAAPLENSEEQYNNDMKRFVSLLGTFSFFKKLSSLKRHNRPFFACQLSRISPAAVISLFPFRPQKKIPKTLDHSSTTRKKRKRKKKNLNSRMSKVSMLRRRRRRKGRENSFQPILSSSLVIGIG